MKSIRVIVRVMTGLVLVLGLCMLASGPPTVADAAYPILYAINAGTYFQVSASPLATAAASSTLDSTGYRLDINPSGYADAGIVLYFDGSLTLANLNTIQITGDGPYAANLWLDVNGDNHFFSFDSSGVLQSVDGDTYGTVANVSSGLLQISDTSTYAGYTLAQLKAGSMAGVNASTRVAIWIGISGSSAETMHLTNLFVNGDPIPLTPAPMPTPTPTPTPTPPPGSQTQPTSGGSSVTVDFGYIKVTFTQVNVPGNTWLGPASVDTSRNPAKSALSIVDIGTSASYQNLIEIAWTYNMSGLENPEKLKMYHFNGSAWENITTSIDTTNNIIYGRVTSLSPFLLSVGGCFIATAAYGSPLDSHVDTLRSFRDQYLETNPIGSAFVSLYYKVSPPMADFIEKHTALKPIVRVALIPAVAMSSIALNTTPVEKTAILVATALLIAILIIWLVRRTRRSVYS